MWPAVPSTRLARMAMGPLARTHLVEARVTLQRLRDRDRAVVALVVLEQWDQRARDRDRRPIERVDELVALRALPAKALVTSP